jgi:adenylylsulfate kinase
VKELIEHDFNVNRKMRNDLNGHPSLLIWFTGLSGSGKSTLANLLEIELHENDFRTYLLDGDSLRLGLNKDLGFSAEDRSENIRRISEVSKLMLDAGLITIAAFVSPFEKDRAMVQAIIGAENYMEIFVDTSLDECMKRDVKGLYKKAVAGEIKEFTGISSPYEKPSNPTITISTEKQTPEEALTIIMETVLLKLAK